MKFDFEYQCDKEWDEMKGGDRRRFCDSCKEHVHHISGMTKEEARKFLEENDFNVCVDFFTDDEGHTVFREARRKLNLQNDGLKQLIASAAAVLPLALAAAFIDFDRPHQDAGRVIAQTEPDPIDLGGPRPVVSNEDPLPVPPPPTPADFDPPDIHPVHADPIPVDPVEPDEESAIEEVEEEENGVDDPVIAPPRPHVRGRIAPPMDWD